MCWFRRIQSMIPLLVLFIFGANAQSESVSGLTTQSPPFVGSVPRDILIRQGDAATLKCPLTSPVDGQVQYQWYRDGQQIPLQNPANSDLTISATASVDVSGLYRCSARNSVGGSVSETTNVTLAAFGPFANAGPDYLKKTVRKNGWMILPPPNILALSPSAADTIHWQWSFYDQAVFSNLTHYVTTKGELVILNAQPAHQGQYSVEAHHTWLNQRLRSPSYELIVQDSTNSPLITGGPEIVLRPRETVLLKGPPAVDNGSQGDVILECVATASNLVDVQIVWTFNNTVVTSNEVKYTIEEFNRRLTVRNPQPFQDSGIYSCEARSGGISGSKAEAIVSVHGPPIIATTLPHVAQAQLGRPVEITCNAVGSPPPIVRWFFNGDSCCRGANISTALAQVLPSGSLVISSMSKEHAGVYQCEATNDAGSIMASTWLRANTQEPAIVDKPMNISAVSGQTITLPCSTTGSPPPTIRWYLNGTEIDVSANSNMQLTDDGLLIKNIAAENGGWYTCQASNSVGKSETKMFVFVAGKTQIVSGPEDQSVIIGSNVVFPCTVSFEAGEGAFARNWYFKTQLLTQGSSRNIELRPDGSLLIRQVGPMNIGSYMCTVTGASGTQRQTGNLKIVEKPGMPLYVKAELINDTLPAKVAISWVDGFDGNSAIIKYVIENRYLGAQSLWSNWEPVMENVRHDQRNVLIDNLKPSTNYEFRVIAINRFGAGMPSLPSNNVTLPQQPPAAAPQNADGSARSASSIMFQWQPPPKDQWNGDILGYVLRYRLANYPDIPWINKNITDPRARNALLDDLITWREYEIQVAAYNDRGMGVFSKSRYITTLEGPPTDSPYNVVVKVLNSTAIHVTLSPPQQQMVPGVNLGYKVEAWKGPIGHGSAAKTLKILPYSLTKIEAVMNGLEKYVRYNITTVCFTSPGDGPRSQPIEITTKQDVPDIVSNFRVEEVLFSSVKLVWDHPIHPNGILTNYTLSYWVSNLTESTKQTSILAPNTTSHKIQGLTPSTRYSFDLYASTAIGRGPSQTANIESGVPPELPGPPTALAISNIQARSVALQFTPGFDGKTTISKWIVEALVGASTNWAPIFNITAPEARAFTVTSLRPYMSYKLRLIAENVVGRSSPSDPSAAFESLQATPEYPPPEADAQPVSATIIKITWTPLQLQAWNGIAKGYIVLWQKAINDSYEPNDGVNGEFAERPTQVIIEDPGASEYRLENLAEYTYYDIILSAYNNIGQSNSTAVLRARTYEAAPASPSGNVSAVAISPREIRVTWQPLSRREAKGRVLGYKISYQGNDKSVNHQEGLETVVGEERSSFVIRGLSPFTQYLVSVSAFTVVGTGPYAPVVTVTTKEDIPSAPSEVVFSVVGNSEARITWKPPYHRNGVITHYSVAFWPQKNNVSSFLVTGAFADGRQGNEGVTKTSLAPDVTMFAATGLTPKTFYVFAVAAETSVGWGHEAHVSLYTANMQVPPPSPGRPAQSVSHPQGPRQITVVWDIVPSTTEPVRIFDISYQRVNDDQWVAWIERIPGTIKTATITGLIPSKAYRFRVRAVNDYGESRYSPESDWIKTLEAEPALPPVDVHAVPFEADGVKISWQAPPFDGWNSDFVGYRILYKQYESNETVKFQELPMSGGDRKQWTYDLKGLPRFNHYIIQMQTFNQEGSSPSSTPVFSYVGFSVPKTPVNRLRAETLSSTQVRVSWDTWPQKDDPVSGFKINYLVVGRPRMELQQDIARPDENAFVLRDMSKFTNFTIEVVPFNKAGDGPSSSVAAQTLPDRPGPVGPLLFNDILVDSVNVSWSPPSEPNGIIIGYLVTYKTYKLEEEYIKQIQEKVSKNYLVVSNLEENVTSTFSVQAETAVGNGPAVSGKVTVGPQPGSPDPPGRPRFQPKENSVTLDWDNSGPGRAPIIAYIIQSSLVDEEGDFEMDGNGNPIRRRPVREVLISPNVVSSLRWDTLALVETPQPIYTVPYNQLQPGGYYRFRVIARNSFGVSYPSAPTDPPLKIPEDSKNRPFYLEWWFLVILALVSLVIIVVIVAVLYVTGRDHKYKYERRNSDQSLHLADGGIVTYELRASKRPQHRDPNGHHGKGNSSTSSTLSKQVSNPYGRHPVSSRPDPLKTLIFDPTCAMIGADEDDGNGVDGSPSASVSRKPQAAASFGKFPNFYHSLGSGVNGGNGSAANGNRQAARSADAVHAMEESRVTEKTDLDESSGDEFNDFDDEEEQNQDKEISSIVQHYETSDGIYRETWRRAKSTAHRPVSTSSQQSDALGAGVVSNSRLGTSPPPPPYSRNAIPNFSSFV